MVLDHYEFEDLCGVVSGKMHDRGGCDCTLRFAQEWLVENEYSEPEKQEVLEFLQSKGGYCDCEIFMNVEVA